jgi:all-trans-retinol 13,14-reductase
MSKHDRFRRLDEDHFDAIVVGAGTGGLTAAALLARRGLRVLVLDQHYVAGGNATVFRRRDYEFDVGLHYVGDCDESGLIPRILRGCGVSSVTFEELDPDGFDTLVFPDLTFRVPKGLDAFEARLLEHFPSERRGIARYMKMLRQVKAFQGVQANPRSALWTVPRCGLLLRYANGSFGRFIASCTSDPRLTAVLAGQHGDYGLAPDDASCVIGLAVQLHYLDGAYFPRGGGQIMADELAAAIERQGGKILLRAEVRRIEVEGGRAAGVTFFNKHTGERTLRAPVVISNADLKKTLLELVGPQHLSPKTVARTRRYDMSPALAALYLGISRDLKAEGHPATNYWINPSYDYREAYAEAARGELPRRPFAYVSIASLKDPTNPRLAPEGVTNLQVMGVVPASYEAWGVTREAFRDGSYREAPAYLAKKEAWAEQMLDAAEGVLPGIREDVVFREVSTPLTHRRYTRATGGTSYGIALTPRQFLWKRPNARTEIPGLYLCGASCQAGHGIAGVSMSGLLAAAEVVGKGLIGEVLRG